MLESLTGVLSSKNASRRRISLEFFLGAPVDVSRALCCVTREPRLEEDEGEEVEASRSGLKGGCRRTMGRGDTEALEKSNALSSDFESSSVKAVSVDGPASSVDIVDTRPQRCVSQLELEKHKKNAKKKANGKNLSAQTFVPNFPSPVITPYFRNFN